MLATRRLLLANAAALSLIGPFAAGRARAETLPPSPPQTEGPFYPETFPLDSDADLVQVRGRAERARGIVTYLEGRLVTQDGRAVPGATIEIWQCDAGGVYHHPRERRGPADANFQGYGRAVTAADGAFRFRTIRPVPYPGRTPHIHAAASGRGFARMVTQLYVAGEPGNERDFLYRSIADPVARRNATLDFAPAPSLEAGALRASARLVLA
jgi:protocatechuate 3,4-dioxygenase beta subunit